jgi:hypothetical protein
MHGRRPARVASRTHEGRTLSSAAACSTSSSGSSNETAPTGSTATADPPSSSASQPHAATQQRSHHPGLLQISLTCVQFRRTNTFHPAAALIIPKQLQEKHACPAVQPRATTVVSAVWTVLAERTTTRQPSASDEIPSATADRPAGRTPPHNHGESRRRSHNAPDRPNCWGQAAVYVTAPDVASADPAFRSGSGHTMAGWRRCARTSTG